MATEERRKRVEYVVKMARLGIMVEPEYEFKEWLALHRWEDDGGSVEEEYNEADCRGSMGNSCSS